MTNDLFERKRIYVNYSSKISSKSKNQWIFIYKIILILFFFAGALSLFLTLDQSLFPAALIRTSNNSANLQEFITFETPSKQENNAVVLIRFSILMFVFLFSIFKNYSNINAQKEKLKHYAVFYVLYFMMSIISLSLFYAFIYKQNDNGTLGKFRPYQYLELIYILIPLVVINSAFEVYNFLIKRKSDPVLYKSTWPLILQVVSQVILAGFVIFNVALWISYSKAAGASLFRTTVITGTNTYNEQKYWEFVDQLFNIKSFSNLIIIAASFVFVIFLVIGSNTIKLQKLSEKNIYKHQDKDSFLIALIFALLVSVWLFTLLLKDPVKFSILGVEATYGINNGLIILLAALATILYFLVSYLKYTKTKNPSSLIIRFSLAQLLIWVPFLVSVIQFENSNFTLINLLVISLLSIGIFMHYILVNKFINKLTFIMLVIIFALKIVLLLILGLNHLLLINKNYVLVSVPTPISVIKIIVITYVSSLFALFVLQALQLETLVTLKIFKEKRFSLKKGN
ncbi:MSC_0624 family F1-like ATPase-associated membrane protein [Mycoplasmopsis bovirhinis]|uniref:Uncharacterized protein n=1 Tax=Mycoplasmopsis bovirhinis TaxID=29553 RepID=A0A449AFE3_9BACT|nr:hypothetical protein [Mycoplasmopsis bovirhinis]VEU63682.1 Uncharacterised protein [Mycoplasmopsis bovirhinis]